MLQYEIPVIGEADQLLYEGLPLLAPVLRQLGDGAVLIGGLATAAWLAARPVGLPVRATRDIDLGINRAVLGLRGDRRFASLPRQAIDSSESISTVNRRPSPTISASAGLQIRR